MITSADGEQLRNGKGGAVSGEGGSEWLEVSGRAWGGRGEKGQEIQILSMLAGCFYSVWE